MAPSPKFRFGPVKKEKPFLRRRGVLGLLALAGLAAVSACAYRGGIEQPLVQKVAWFSYLNGDDIRAACVPGAATHYRIVYNGEYNRQVRTYEILGTPDGASYLARVQRGGGIDLLNLSPSRLEKAGGWTTWRTDLSSAQMAELERALEASGAFRPAPQGLNLASEEFFWLFVGCRDATVRFHAWRYEDGGFGGLSFPSVLLRLDQTGVALNPPRDVGPIDRVPRGPPVEDPKPRFDLLIGENGLSGLAPRL